MSETAHALDALTPYVKGLYAPVGQEITSGDLTIIGRLPSDLNGMFVHNGANPRFINTSAGYSWFDGDGMVQGIQLDDGDAVFRSRWVKTAGLAEDIAAGQATYIGSNAKPGIRGKRHKNVANTDLVYHSGRLLALWWEGGEPYELSLPELDTVGAFTYGGTLNAGMTSHAKVDPKSGELFFITWGTRAPFLHVGVAGNDGRILHHVPVDLPGPRVQHDVGMSDRYVCVFDFPMELDFNRPEQTSIGFVLNDERPARIGLLDRRDLTKAVRWFEVSPCFMWHLSSAWDEGDEFVLVGVRIEGATRYDRHRQIRDDLPLVDGEHRFDAHPFMWRLNLRTGAVTERQLDDAYVEFPRVNDAYICSGARYSYMASIPTDQPTLKTTALLKYDLHTGKRQTLHFPEHHVGYEASFAPRAGGRGEDDGYLLNFVTNETDMTSEFWITPAEDIESGPIARIKLPQKVPAKFHGRWLPADLFGG